jgi:hypothetical protein
MSDSFGLSLSCTPTQDAGADGEVVFGDARLIAKPRQAPTTTSPSSPAKVRPASRSPCEA